MITKLDVFNRWAGEWRSLAAWGAPLHINLTIKPYNGQRLLGWAYPHRGDCVVRLTGDLPRDLATALHEMAHLAAPSYVMHELPWRQMFARAAGEALGEDPGVIELDVDLFDLDKQVMRMVYRWLERSGQHAVLSALGVL